MSDTIQVSIVGASGYTGGEALRLLLGHPRVEVKQVTSERFAGKQVTLIHPNLRSRTKLKFSSINDLAPCDVIISGLPHGTVAGRIDQFLSLAPKIIDKSADFRLRTAAGYQTWYDYKHPRPDLLSRFVYGIPEIHRKEIASADLVACAGCHSTVSILALYPFIRRGLVDLSRIIIDAKTSSSEAGNEPNLGTHHPERSRVVRSYALTGHRHIAEIEQELGAARSKGENNTMSEVGNDLKVHFSATAVELVRGILVTCHLFLHEQMTDKDVWQILREDYGDEPFIRIVKEHGGVYRLPEPKILEGTNYCDIGFQLDPRSKRLVVVAAIDNLMKGAAGQAVQCLNAMMHWDETLGLEFTGLHPV
ncbi:N-acetyl-gamma-glutamyl-phosphate reductase [Candidatus Wirthbacteria bacterium CG2_30_54_11]|uniref:N-acetyl-gamma-glutamyl-phosphate reductase n=1 Tax=Candidatus Wirthbacteria bacterium CG2_30_54_11 TaxID=1817892 RepID=A0A1J5IWP0_9BACT|nr:MAG: N-acetyl-gamma-glutamyl-phosphate reductase [Candidatus Wirthbacteria bacterium CG2_30_54_11]